MDPTVTLLMVGQQVLVLLLYQPLLENIRRWRRAALVALCAWAAVLFVEELAFVDSRYAEAAVAAAAVAVTAILLGFVVVVVRNPAAISTEDNLITSAVQVVLAVLIWVSVAVVIAASAAAGSARSLSGGLGDGVRAVVWQSVDTIPVLSVPNTIGWENPARSAGPYTGWHMLLARVAFVVSVLAVGKAVYEGRVAKLHRERDDPI